MSQKHSPLPFLAVLTAIALYAAMDTLMKDASIAIGAYSASLLRSIVGVGLALPLWLASKPRRPSRGALAVHLKRGVVAAFVALTFFYSLVRLPMAEAIAISFIYPLITLLLAGLMLGEKVQPRSIGASLLGLAGVLVIAAGQMEQRNAHPEALWGIAAVLVSAVLYAWNLILQRQQSLLARPAEVALFQSGVMGLTLLVAAPLLFVWPDAHSMKAIAGATLFGTVSLMLASWAYGRAEAQALVPLEYSAFIWNALAGWLYFEEKLTAWTLGGMVLISAASLVASPRRRRALGLPQGAETSV